MEGAAVAAALQRAKKRGGRESKKILNPNEHLDALIDIPPAVFIDQIDKLDEILQNQKAKRLFGAGSESEKKSEIAARQIKLLEGLIAKVAEKIRRSASYGRLAATSVFFIIYVACLFLQRDIMSAYSVESSFVNNAVGKLPTTGSGGYFNSGTGATGVVSSADDVYTWLQSMLVDVFNDPVCGDGECSAPNEYAGFGRFGCNVDCGSYLETTTLTLDLQSFLDSSPDDWNLRTVSRLEEGATIDPGFKYNIYSETMGDFLFASDLTNTSVTFEVPDGKLMLRLYQTNIVSTITEASAIYEVLSTTTSTLPEREARSDYAYGDHREMLAVSAGWVEAINDYCWGRGVQGIVADTNCWLYTDTTAIFNTLGGYGFEGTITMTNKSTSGTTSETVTLATVSFCGVFDDTSDSNKAANVALLQEASTTCPAKKNRRFSKFSSSKPKPSSSPMRRSRAGLRASTALLPRRRFRQQNNLDRALRSTVRSRKGAKRMVASVGGSGGNGRRLAQTGGGGGGGGGSIALSPAEDMQELEWEKGWCCSNAGPTYDTVMDLDWSGMWGTITFTNPNSDSVGSYFMVSYDGRDPLCNGASSDIGDATTYERLLSPVTADESFSFKIAICSMDGTRKSPTVDLNGKIVAAPRLAFAALLPGYNNNTMVESSEHWHAALVTAYALEARDDRAVIDSVEVDSSGSGIQITATLFAENSLQLSEWKSQLEQKSVAETDLGAALATAGGSGGVELVGTSADVGGVSTEWVVGGEPILRFETCSSHLDCATDEYGPSFCANWGTISPTPTCDICELCRVDADDTYDGGECPQDLCPGSGGVPKCINGTDLVEDAVCRDSYDFEVWSYIGVSNSTTFAEADFVEPAGFSRTGNTTGRYAPVVKPPSTTTARFVTPFNRLVGAIVITQERSEQTTCSGIASASVKNYTSAAGVTCPSDKAAADPYGFDPTFMSSSASYNGKLNVEEFYTLDERHYTESNGETVYTVPKGFFPHSYDQVRHQTKTKDQIWSGDENKFKLYLDERLTQSEAMKMLEFATDGKFIDEQTKSISVEMVTFNADKNIFSVLSITFSWETGGTIPWDYTINTLSVDLYQGTKGTIQRVLEIFCIICLIVNVVAEIRDVMHETRAFNLLAYLTNPFNWVDWCHFCVMAATFTSWVVHANHAAAFTIEGAYNVLEDPGAQAKLFATDADAEKKFMQLIDDMETISDSMASYSTFAGISVVLFVFRILKGLDFQERMALVTRTIESASSDLAHFFGLFGIVFFGYAVVGTLLFGHQFDGMMTVDRSALTLMVFLLSFDSTQFYASMSHAAQGYALHLFLWSFLVITFFILLNIFLAILVDAYANVKRETEDALGLPEELAMVTIHTVKSMFWPKKWFVSDQELLKALKKMRAELSSPISIQEQVRKTLSHKRSVLLPQGVEIDNLKMAELVSQAFPHTMQPSKSFKGTFKHPVHPDSEEAAEGGQQAHLNVFRGANNDIVHDLMKRYGEDMSGRMEQRDREVLEVMELENLKRTLAIFTAQSRMIREQKRVVQMMEHVAKTSLPPEVWESITPEDEATGPPGMTGTLEVELVQGEKLPRMDMLSACDPYAVMYIDGVDGDYNIVNTSDFKTKCTNPVWNEKFKWHTSDDSTTLTVTIWDKDNLSQDDIIGCCYIDLVETRNVGWVERWYALENPQLAMKLRSASIKLRHNHISNSDRPSTAAQGYDSNTVSGKDAAVNSSTTADGAGTAVEIAINVAPIEEGVAEDATVQKAKYESSKVTFASLRLESATLDDENRAEANGHEGNGNGTQTKTDSEDPPAWTDSMREILGC